MTEALYGLQTGVWAKQDCSLCGVCCRTITAPASEARARAKWGTKEDGLGGGQTLRRSLESIALVLLVEPVKSRRMSEGGEGAERKGRGD